jgi:ribosome-associated protein
MLILLKMVKVNNEIETRRGRKLRKGDIVEVEKKKFEIV